MTEKDHRKTKNGIQKRLVIAKLVQELPAKLLAIVANQTCHFQGTYRLVTYLPQTWAKVDFLVTKTDQTICLGLFSDQTNTNIQK